MDAVAVGDVYEFSGFRLDRSGGGLFRADRQAVPLGSRALDLLQLLIDRKGELVSKQEILDVVWAGLAVEEGNLTVQMSALRRAIDAGAGQASCIQTVPGRGYRFVASAERVAGEVRPGPAAPPVVLPPRRPWPRIAPFAAAAAGLAVVASLLAAFLLPLRREAAPRMSLAVLPFEVLSDQAGQEYLADAITDDLTTDLSHVQGAFVIARGSVYRFRGQAVAPQKLGAELGVRYLVQGSVRTLGPSLRVSAQLVSTETGAILWTDRIDAPRANYASGETEIVNRIGAALGIGLVDIEAARSMREHETRSDAFDLVLRARAIQNGGRGRERDTEALQLYELALQRDPEAVPAMLGVARILIDRHFGAIGQWATAEDLGRAANLIDRAKSLQPIAEDVLVAAAEIAQAQERWTDLDFIARQIVERYPNRAEGYELLGMAKRFVGSPSESVRLYEQAIRLNPLESSLYRRCSCMGYALLLTGRYDESITWFERSLAANPNASDASRGARFRSIAAAYAVSGRLEMAQAAMRKAQELSPHATARIWFPDNANDPAQVAHMLRLVEGLRLAGLADHVEEDRDFGLQSDGLLHPDLSGPTPLSIPSVQTIKTLELARLLSEQGPVVLDTMLYSWGRSIPGAVGLKNIGLGGTFEDGAQQALSRVMQGLTSRNRDRPVVAVGFNALRFDGYNLAIRLTALGYTNVYWYRGGREAWEVAGRSETQVIAEGW